MFFRKTVFFRKQVSLSRKRSFTLTKHFSQPENIHENEGVPFNQMKILSKNVCSVPKKTGGIFHNCENSHQFQKK